MDRQSTYVIVGAHPDDNELSAGLLAVEALDKGNKVYSVTVTKGDKNNAESRLKEWDEASARIGYTGSIIMDYPDTMIGRYEDDIRRDLEIIAKEFNPDYVVFHSEKDRHQDHRVLNGICSIAFRGAQNLYKMHSPSTRTTFNPSIYLSSENTLNAFKKAYAVGAYKSQSRIANPQQTLQKLASSGREVKTHQEIQDIGMIEESGILEELVAWDPIETGIKDKEKIRGVYLGILVAYPPGTVFAEGYEPNHIIHRF
ncbi:MAG: PIG-L deacetylase family protein [Candidatus Woesearchaeota archaeon]